MMKTKARQFASIFGILLGIGIIIAGICVMNPETYTIGDPWMEFGGDFQTEIYDVTRAAGSAIQRAYKNICHAIGWLIITLGIADIGFFLYQLAHMLDLSAPAAAPVQKAVAPQVEKPAKQVQAAPPVSAPKAEEKVTNEVLNDYWICGKCKTKNLASRVDCWSCGNSK